MRRNPLDKTIEEDHPWLKAAHAASSMDWFRKWTSDKLRDNELDMSGSEVRSAIDRGERTHGKPGAIPDDWVHRGIQFGANVLAGAASLLTAPIMFGVDFIVTGGRELSEGAARLYAKHYYGNAPEGLPYVNGISSKEAIQRGLEKGDFTWSAHRKRLVSRTREGLKGAVMSLSPAVTMSVLAKEDQRARAFAEGMYIYPVESIVGPLFTLLSLIHI